MVGVTPRILMVVSQFFPRLGGAEQQALNLAAALQLRSIPVCVLTRAVAGLPHEETIRRVPVYRAIKAYPGSRWFSLTYFLSTLWFFIRRRHTYDIIHCHILQGLHTPAALLAKALLGKRVIIKVAATGPGSDFFTLRSLRFAKLGIGAIIARRLNNADRIIALCNLGVREAREAGIAPDLIECIPNGVDTAYFTPHTAPVYMRITTVGRLDHMKGVGVLIEAFARLREQQGQAELYIIGDGPDRGSLQRLAGELGLGACVVFTGESTRVVDYLRQTSVFALPSLSEGLSNVVLEAMACGLPVVATRAGGTPEIITDGVNGILVAPEDPEELAHALLSVLSDRVLAIRLGDSARRTAVERFSLASVARRYADLYHTLMSPRTKVQTPRAR
jgi:L-malate glycosyltransferase